MFVDTVRFGRLTVEANNVLLFPDGLVGFEEERHWILLADGNSDSVGWLQSAGDPALALPVVTPHRYVPDFSLGIKRADLASLPWKPQDQAIVLVIVSHNDDRLTVNLKAPLVVNLDRCLGRQIIAVGSQPLKYELSDRPGFLKQSA